MTRARVGVLGLSLLVMLATAGCGNAREDAGGAPPSAAPGSAGVTGLPVPRNLNRSFSRLLDQRARSLLAGDRAAFTAGLDVASKPFVGEQEVYFDNLRQLPLATMGYRLVPASLVRTGTSYWVVVEVTSQLQGFDALPVTTPDRYRFSPTRSRGHYKLSSTTDEAWETANHVSGQPWDDGPVQVRTRPGVLGVFDGGTVGHATDLMASIQRGIADVRARVPYTWPGTVVFYALSDDAFLTSLGPVPGGDPENLDGVAFTVPSSAQDPTVAATRIVLNPSILTASPPTRDRLVRHELTHVAVGDHDAHAPVWLSEGLAEWVSVQAMASDDRQVSAAALSAAEAPGVQMPGDASFNGPDAAAHYAIAWWSCEYLARTLGAATPWILLDALDAPHVDERAVTRQITGLTPDALARRGARLMVTTYDPSFYAPSPPPTAPLSPAAPTPGTSPTAAPTPN